MRKKAPKKIESQSEWFVASLTPAAMSLFSDSFYPQPGRAGEMKVFVAVNQNVNENPNTINVRVMNGFNPKTIRMLTKFVANKCLSIKRKVTKPEFEKIKEALDCV